MTGFVYIEETRTAAPRTTVLVLHEIPGYAFECAGLFVSRISFPFALLDLRK